MLFDDLASGDFRRRAGHPGRARRKTGNAAADVVGEFQKTMKKAFRRPLQELRILINRALPIFLLLRRGPMAERRQERSHGEDRDEERNGNADGYRVLEQNAVGHV